MIGAGSVVVCVRSSPGEDRIVPGGVYVVSRGGEYVEVAEAPGVALRGEYFGFEEERPWWAWADDEWTRDAKRRALRTVERALAVASFMSTKDTWAAEPAPAPASRPWFVWANS